MTGRGAPLSRPLERLAEQRGLDAPASRLAELTEGRRGPLVEWARGAPLGHPAHPALTDLPIGFWTSAWVLDIVGGRRGAPAARALVGWGVLSAVPTIATGLADVPTLSPARRRVAVLHAAVNTAATAGFGVSWYLRRRGRRAAGVATSFGAGTLASLGGYLGGWLAFGEEPSEGPSAESAADAGPQLATRVADRLGGRQLATAESCTAGRIASAFAQGGNAAEFFRGSLVSYQERVKREQLDVTAESVYSAEAASQMALAVCELLGADAGVATSGVVGDDAEDGVPPGTVFIATAVDGNADARDYRFEGTPDEVCDRARDQALRDLATALDHAGPLPRST